MNISLQKLIDTVVHFIVSLGMVAFPIGSAFGLKFYGFPIVALLWGIWFIMAFPIDIALGYRVARRHGVANSGIMWDWLITKTVLFVLILMALTIAWVLSYVSTNENIGIWASICSLILILAFSFREFMSIVENMAVLEPEWKDKGLWLRLAKMMGIWVELARKKIEKRVEDITL